MKRLNIFITAMQLKQVKTAQSVSGMWLGGGQSMADPAWEVEQLRKAYNLPEGTGLDPTNGEFVSPNE